MPEDPRHPHIVIEMMGKRYELNPPGRPAPAPRKPLTLVTPPPLIYPEPKPEY